jgi:hypothetical protein
MRKEIKKTDLTLFSQSGINEHLENLRTELRTEVNIELKDDYILKVSELECIEYLLGKYTILTPSLDFQNSIGNYTEEDCGTHFQFITEIKLPMAGDYNWLTFSAGDADWVYPVWINKTEYYDEDVYSMRYGRPLSIDEIKKELVAFEKRLQKNTFIWNSDERLQEYHEALGNANMIDPYIYLHVECKEGSGRKAGIEIRKVLSALESKYKVLVKKITKHNNEVKSLVPKLFYGRKQRVIRNLKTLESSGLKIEKRKDLPETYTVPVPEIQKQIRLKPTLPDATVTPDPTLDQEIYNDILQTMHDIGKSIERLPGVYRNRHEPDLRDLFLIYLQPRYTWSSVTGETFNNTGRTDILIRYENANIFVAECKIWAGTQCYVECITQLLKYVNWRDTKTAIILFARTKQISSVTELIEEATQRHPNYIALINKKEKSWFNYLFHINGDRRIEVKLAVLVLHIPSNPNQIVLDDNA